MYPSSLPNIDLQVLPTFPAHVGVTGVLTLVKSGLSYTFGVNFQNVIEETNVSDMSKREVLVQDTDTGAFWRVKLSNLPTGQTDWGSIQNKPATFPPSPHTHPVAEISDATVIGRNLVTAADAAAARAAIGAVNKAGDAMTGQLSVSGTLFVNAANASASPALRLTDETGVRRGTVYWDRTLNQVWVALHDATGAVVNNIRLSATGATIGTSPIWTNANKQIADGQVLGNVSGSTGVPVGVTLSALLDKISNTRGAVLYRGASGWTALGAGTAGQVLTSGGAGADPSWQDKPRDVVSVKDFGAVGDGVTDDTAAFQAAAAYFGSGGSLFESNGGVLFVPKGLYKVTGQTLFQRTGVRIIGEGLDATKITVAADLGDAAVFKFDQILSYYSMVGAGVENLSIHMNGFTGHGVHMIKPYDGVSLRNLFVEDVADGYNGYRIEPDPDNTADTISQTVVLENCLARHKNATATAPLFYLSNLQESVLTACKAFGTYEWHGKAPCYPFEFVDCRGIVLNGCSSAFASKHGVKITVLTRPSTGFLIANHTFETIDGAVRADGLAGIGDVIGLCVINPRIEGAVANASGVFDLNRVIRSSIDAGTATVNIDADSIANIVLSRDTTQVTNAGDATTILGSANQADPRYKIIAGGLRVSNAGTQHLVTSNESVQLYSSGEISAQADYPFSPSQTGVLLAVNRGGTVTLSRVEIGEADSGGVGFRMLRVAN